MSNMESNFSEDNTNYYGMTEQNAAKVLFR